MQRESRMCALFMEISCAPKHIASFFLLLRALSPISERHCYFRQIKVSSNHRTRGQSNERTMCCMSHHCLYREHEKNLISEEEKKKEWIRVRSFDDKIILTNKYSLLNDSSHWLFWISSNANFFLKNFLKKKHRYFLLCRISPLIIVILLWKNR